MAHKILLADSNNDWIKKAKHFLENERYAVDTATNGKDAQLLLGRNQYLAMVLALGLKNHSGLQVLRFVSDRHPHLKVIMLWDKRPDNEDHTLQILEELQQYGIDNILTKSENFMSLKKELENPNAREILPPSPLPSNETPTDHQIDCDDEQFSKVKIEEFYTSGVVPFDIFIRLKKSRYIKILKAEETVNEQSLARYRNNDPVKWLYFKKKDLDKYVKLNNALAGRLVEQTTGKTDTKLELLKNVSEKYLEQSFYAGINTKVLEQGKAISRNISKLIEKEEQLIQYLSFYNGRGTPAVSHTFLVTIFSIAILKKFNWQSPKTLEAMAMACLFHDIGLFRLPPELVKKSPQDMTFKELILYKKHPQWGAEMLGNNRIITTTVKQIIGQHHEYYDGSGHPQGISRNQILIPANILSLADDFVHKIMEYDILPYQTAKLFLATLPQGRYHPAILNHFMSLFAEDIRPKNNP